MKQPELDSEFSIIREQGFSLSNKALVQIIQEVLSRGRSVRLEVKGWSMFPCIRGKDILTVSPLDGHASYIGLPVAFTNPSSSNLVIHRVIGQRQDAFIIKGDCVSGADGVIRIKNILGVVTKVERNNRLVRFGWGKERWVITFFNKTNLFFITSRIGGRLPIFIRKFIKKLFFK